MYSSAPSAAVSTSAMQRRGDEAERTTDADVAVGSPGMRTSNRPSRSDAYVYAVYNAMVPVAKLTTPELR